MVRFTLNRGRSHGINPGEIVGGIASRADIPGSGIGRITINQENTLVDIKEEFATAVLNKSGTYHFKRHHNMELIEVKDR
jgi:ATP-dependent RNA helicase DeaD